MRKKKSQMKMGESIGILFIFILLVALGIVFWTKLKSASIQEQVQEEQTLQAIQVAQEISFLPEIQCSSENIITDNCFDILKMEALIEYFNDTPTALDYYYNVLRTSKLTLEVVYPVSSKQWVLYDYPIFLNTTTREIEGDGVAQNITFLDYSKITTVVPVSLYDARSRQYYFGKLTVDVYQR